MDQDTLPTTESEARAEVAELAATISDFRDEQRWGLVRVGSAFVDATMLTSLFTFLVLVLALTRAAPPEAIVAGAAFYLAGSLAGLFKRVHAEAQGDAGAEDYNFTGARLWRTPVLSGLAALGGVMLIAMSPALIPPTTQGATAAPTQVGQTLAAQQLTPVPSAPARSSTAIPSLDEIFDLVHNPQFLVLAAVFGLTPGLLLGRLQQLGDQYKANLSSTETA